MKPWTEGRIRGFIVSVLRSGMRRWPPKWNALNNAYVGLKVNEKTGRNCKHYECASCKNHFPSKNVQVDHNLPVVDPKTGFTTWDDYIKRLYCTEENLQILCVPCHKKKSKAERYE